MLAANDLSLAGRLDRVTLALRPGEVTAIVGPNGAGKSTLIAALAGLVRAGPVTLGEAPLAAITPRERARRIGYLPQAGEAAWDVSVRTLAGLGRLPWGDEDAAPVARALAALDLAGLADRPLSTLSGGERARAMLARVLAGTPRWLLADEPLAALDLAHREALAATLRALAADGMGVVVVLHDLALAMNHADRVVVLGQGRVVADGPPDDALSPAVIAAVWGVSARWLGARGARALAVGPAAALSPGT
ncbi:ABC transporter ATP-binding protein [Parablastomonas sp. CN1-191]|uniref:ABC transporter ATP-binding protein n=1 Tax=Parablastomonas sp. CN1-191 TaxID=3400908 RepID=UPI003BF8A182